jgi:hypothetical protein
MACRDQPIFAEIAERSNEDETFVRLVLFSKGVERVFLTVNHHDEAVAWMDEWNEHFDRVWLGIRETSAALMESFARALQNRGVGQNIIDATLEDMKHDARS